jgi:hypothetical protein
VILAGFVTLSALVAGPSNEGISLARRSPDQNDIAAMALGDLCKSCIDFRDRCRRAQFEPDCFQRGTRPFNRKERVPVGLGNIAIEKTVVISRRVAIELTKKASKPKRLECRGFLFHGERDSEGS